MTSCSLYCDLHPEWNSHALQQLESFLVGLGRCDHGDVHSHDLLHLIVVYLREDYLLGDSKIVISSPVEGVGRGSPEITDSGDGHVHQPV